MAGFNLSPNGSTTCRTLPFGLRTLISMPVLLAMGIGTMPVRAMPGASVQLFRVNGNGLKTMPGITDVLDRAQAQRTAQARATESGQPEPMLMAQSSSTTTVVDALSKFRQTFVSGMPTNLSGYVKISRIDPNTGLIGEDLETININNSNLVSFTNNRTEVEIALDASKVKSGDTLIVRWPEAGPEGSFAFPNHITPCEFTAATATATAGAAVPLAAAAVPAAAAATFPVALVVLGALAVAAIVTVVVVNNDGGGGTNPSSQ